MSCVAWLQEFGLGCCVGLILDRVHIRFKIVSYDNSDKRLVVGGQPIWVPPLFGASAVVFSFVSQYAPRFYARRIRFPRSYAAWFVLMYLFSAFKWLLPVERAILMALLFILRATRQSAKVNIYCLLCAGIGCLVESVLIRRRFFCHLETDWAQLPAWLPFLYMHAAPFIRTCHQFLRNQ